MPEAQRSLSLRQRARWTPLWRAARRSSQEECLVCLLGAGFVFIQDPSPIAHNECSGSCAFYSYHRYMFRVLQVLSHKSRWSSVYPNGQAYLEISCIVVFKLLQYLMNKNACAHQEWWRVVIPMRFRFSPSGWSYHFEIGAQKTLMTALVYLLSRKETEESFFRNALSKKLEASEIWHIYVER